MKSKTSIYYISVETKSKHVVLFFPPFVLVFKYEYAKKEKEMQSNLLTSSLTSALLNRGSNKRLQN